MHRLITLSTLLLLCATAAAGPVNIKTAQTAGTHYLQQNGLMKATDTLTLCDSWSFRTESNEEVTCFYVFNLDDEGFVIVSADDRCTPIIGRSMNGAFRKGNLPDNLQGWLDNCAQEIEHGILANAPEDKQAQARWEKLLAAPAVVPPAPKSESHLLSSTWDQGSGYNEYCPTLNGEHVVVGCVATAMAQIIRYWGYPSRGFGKKKYVHSYYGQQSADFDTANFDYSLMPDKMTRRTTAAQKHMCSLLCYYCGVVVNMEYQHPGHTSGSGSHTENVVDGILHFGYTDCEIYSRVNVNNDSLWRAMIVNEIDNLRPIEYAGSGSGGAHAFVLDGYNHDDEYHFNWGWGGYGDGYYTLTTMQGFTSSHDMVINMKPSGWDGRLTHFLVSPDGNGDGTSWENANKNLASAVKLNKLSKREIWMKEGIYYGDTAASYAYTLTYPVSIYGGFDGTESSTRERNVKLHRTILDGRGQHGVLYAKINSSSNATMDISDITIQNGYSKKGTSLNLIGNIKANQFVVRNCQSDSGSAVSLEDCLLRRSYIYGNSSPVVCKIDGAALRQTLVCNNDGTALALDHGCRVANCDIVSNAGFGASIASKSSSFVNNIVWNNDSCIRATTELYDTCIRYCALESDTALLDSTLVLLDRDNNAGPRFISPSHTRGIAGLGEEADWHLSQGSPCIDAGVRISECVLDGDLDQSVRVRNSVIDLGCYESNYPVSISDIEQGKIAAYPNPATTTLSVEGCPRGEVKLFDITGRMVMSQESNGSLTLDVTSLPQGIYFLRAGAYTAKIVKE